MWLPVKYENKHSKSLVNMTWHNSNNSLTFEMIETESGVPTQNPSFQICCVYN